MTVVGPEVVARPARFRTDPHSQAALLPRILETIERLRRFCHLEEAVSRGAHAALLPALGQLLFRSPYYVERLSREGFSPYDLAELEDLQCFPSLDRQTLAEEADEIALLDREDPDRVVVWSSGSTGAPVAVYRDRYECVHMWGVIRFWAEQLTVSIPNQPTVVLLCTLPGGLEYEAPLPLFYEGALTRVSTVLPRARQRLEALRPAVISTDPAGLHWLLDGGRMESPKLLLSSAQYLSPALRSQCETPVLNYYATTETGPIAWECLTEAGRFHVLSPDVWVESVDRELLVTRLRGDTLPLLRYRTGDTGEVCYAVCACGVSGWVIEDFSGRHTVSFQRPDGSAADAWQLAWLFKGYDLSDFHLRQLGVASFELTLVGETGGSDLEVRLRDALRNMGWGAVGITVRSLSSLPRQGAKPAPFSSCL